MKYFAGIDIGSTSIKIVLADDREGLFSSCVNATGSHFHHNTMTAFKSLLAAGNIERQQVEFIVSTGYGRKLFKEADDSISEITANAIGARKVGENNGPVRTVINIGGQDLKIISLDEDGHVKNFTMNDKCAAGTGRFLEMTARNLEIEVDMLGDLHLKAAGIPATINSTCTVFAESEIIGLLANGTRRAELVAGIHYSIARRVARLGKRLGLQEGILFDGGPAVNSGLVQAMEDELMHEVIVPEKPQLTTAYGAALLAREIYLSNNKAVNG